MSQRKSAVSGSDSLPSICSAGANTSHPAPPASKAIPSHARAGGKAGCRASPRRMVNRGAIRKRAVMRDAARRCISQNSKNSAGRSTANRARSSGDNALQRHAVCGAITLATAKQAAPAAPASAAMGKVESFATVRASLTAKQFATAMPRAAATSAHSASAARTEPGTSRGKRKRMPATAPMEPASAAFPRRGRSPCRYGSRTTAKTGVSEKTATLSRVEIVSCAKDTSKDGSTKSPKPMPAQAKASRPRGKSRWRATAMDAATAAKAEKSTA